MRCVLLAIVATVLSCAASENGGEVRTLSSGHGIEVVAEEVVSAQEPYLWFQYRSSAEVPDELRTEIASIWDDIRVDAEGAGVSTVFIDALKSHRELQWDGWWPGFSEVEKGCVTFTQQKVGWASSELACCLMGPCESWVGQQSE